MAGLFLSLFLLLLPTFSAGGDDIAEARKLVDARQFDAAKTLLEQMISRDGTQAEARMLLGRILNVHFRKFDDAEE